MSSKNITWIELVPGTERRALASAAAIFTDDPADALKLVGVTGTNGKTTTAYLVDSILRAAGRTTGLLGTIGYRTPQGSRAARTPRPNRSTCSRCSPKCATPEARTPCSKPVRTRWRWIGCGAASSRWRFSRISRATISIITRRSRIISRPSGDCLKAPAQARPDVAVINADDPYGRSWQGLRRRTLTYGLKGAPD